ncbi:MAG: class I SAM-dependent methyltransferase [Actinomycetota bacterium]
MSEAWDRAARWWIDAVRDDPANSTDVLDLLRELVPAPHPGRTLDVGCGEGQAMRLIGDDIIGTDIAPALLAVAATAGPVVAAELPDVSWCRSEVFHRCICVGVIDLIADRRALLHELHRVTQSAGELVVVANHPVTTAPHAAPMVDPRGEVFWRWGDYLAAGTVEQDLGDQTVVLHHQPLGDLTTTAADAGWSLDRMIERGPSAATIARYPEYAGQTHVPTLIGIRWTKRM